MSAINLPNSGGTATNTYNGDGLRFSRTDSLGTNSYLWNSQVLEAELGNGNTVSMWYTQGEGQYGDVISTRDAVVGTSSLQLYDAPGNVSQTTDSGANITTTLAYDTFGVVTDNSGSQNPTVARQGKQGYQFESTLGPAGLQYVRQRWYDPTTQQFISPDPLRFAGGDVDLFRYAANNPINRSDPGGRDTINDLTLQNTSLPPVSPPMPPTPLAPRKPSHPIMRHGSIAGHGSTSLLPFENLFQPMSLISGLGSIEAPNPLVPHFDSRPYDILSLGISASLAITVQVHNQDVRMALAGQLNPKMIEGPWGYRFVELNTSREPGSGAYLATGLMIYGAPLAATAGGVVHVAWNVANIAVGTIQAVSGTVHGVRALTHHLIAAGLINLAGAGLGVFIAHGGLRLAGADDVGNLNSVARQTERTALGENALSVRVTQLYDPSRGSFGPGTSTALSSPTPNPFLRWVEGSKGGTWVAPQRAEDISWFARMMTDRGSYTHYVEFSVSPAELQNPGGLKFLYSPFQQIIPNTINLSDRGAVFGQLKPNYGQKIFFIAVAAGGGYLVYQSTAK